jgi:hypothetical protein
MTVRFTPAAPCPVCGGHEKLPRGAEKRCAGFASDDGVWVRCTRVESPALDDRCVPPAYRHRMRDLCRCGVQHGPDSRPVDASEPEAEYVYRDEAGAALMRVLVRGHGKSKRVRQERATPGGWVSGIAGVRRVLYRLPELLAAPLGTCVWIVEGERDVETLRGLGYVATCNLGGAGKWPATETLPGRTIAIIADDDEPGWAHAEYVRQVTGRTPMAVWRCTKGKDVTDHVASGGKFPDELGRIERVPQLTADEILAVREILKRNETKGN